MEPSAKTSSDEKVFYLLEKQQGFSHSLLWIIQRQYFDEKGADAWRQGEVPHYITSNPAVADSYAEIVFACRRDRQRLASCDEPMYVCELGAGSGRFAFHFLRRLALLCESAKLALTSFRYVLTDFTQSNLNHWREHPRFQEFFESGVLDISLFDINESDQLALQLSGMTVSAGTLNHPLIVIANYLFDSVPQELFYIKDQRCHQCLVSLLVDDDPDTLTTAELLKRIECLYEYEALTEVPYAQPFLKQLLAEYQLTLTDTHLLFPAAGLLCLQRLKALSVQGLLLLSADKGDHRLETLQDKAAPDLVRHGSFSLSVNYHALKRFCEQGGGIALFPDSHHRSLDVGCLLMLGEASAHVETQRAYQRHVQDFSPDDFFTIAEHARQHLADMSVGSILAYLRLGYYDSQQFAHYWPRLMELAHELNGDERRAVVAAIDKVWELYFTLSEGPDLAYKIACLLYEMDDYARALTYFERSVEIYGEHTGTLFNMAACCQLTGQPARAESLLRKVLRYDPDNQEARALLAGAEA